MYEQVYKFENLYNAFRKTRKGKQWKNTTARYEINLLEATALLSEQLQSKTYTVSPYTVFYVYEPKKREVKTNSLKDKVVQESLCTHVLEPLIEPSFILDNYASQVGKGTHFGLNRLAEFMRRYYRENGFANGWVLKCDIKKYFYRIQHEPLKRMVRKYIKEPDVLWLVDLIIDSTEDPGIPIGNQTSQIFALLYLNGMDHLVKDKLGVKFYGRYMDDFYLIHKDKDFLRKCLVDIQNHVGNLGLELNDKTQIFPLKNGIDFLGFHTYLTDTGKVIRKVRRRSKNNFRRKLKKFKVLVENGKMTQDRVELSYQSWRGHVEHGNCHHLLRNMDELYRKLFNTERSGDKPNVTAN
jgi:hypothetical protein